MLIDQAAQVADDIDALLLADRTRSVAAPARDWTAFAEFAHGAGGPREQRWSLDVQIDQKPRPGWRLVLADRLDVRSSSAPPRHDTVNMLKEAWLSWQANDDTAIDAGRINAYQGVALGYNPTDVFRDGAVRSVVSLDPESVKKNRLGSVMLRVQHFWPESSLTALISPKLADDRNHASFNPDFGATNHVQRWQLSYSHRPLTDVSAQWLLTGTRHTPAQLGVNLTAVASQAAVAYLEWSGGRSRSQWAQVVSGDRDQAMRHRLSAGGSYTTANKLTMTLEYEYDGGAPASASSNRQFRMWQQVAQELASRQEWLAHASWTDALVSHFDLNALLKTSVADRSQLVWAEGRYRLRHAELALQWQRRRGSPLSTYGAAAASSWQLSWRGFL
jgi:hypothetical protein